MKSVLFAVVLLTGTAATAQMSAPAYPPCSSTMMDKCTETGMMHKPMMKHRKPMKHHKMMAKKPMAAEGAMAPAPDATPAMAPSK